MLDGLEVRHDLAQQRFGGLDLLGPHGLVTVNACLQAVDDPRHINALAHTVQHGGVDGLAGVSRHAGTHARSGGRRLA